MTEQQILDKTIEYLNKYSNNFKNWHIDKTFYSPQLVAEIYICGDHINSLFNPLEWLLSTTDELLDLTDDDYHREKIKADNIFISEFRIAHNIIKDLAQNGTNN